MVSVMLPLATFASSFPNIKFDNGQTTTDCTAGQTVNFTARVNVPSGEVVEKIQVDVLSDSLAPALAQDVGGTLGLQEGQHDVSLTAPCPQNTGYYTIEVRGAGIFGGQRSNSITDGVVSVNTFSNALRVVASGSTGGNNSPQDTAPNWLTALMAQMQAQMAALIASLKPGTGGGVPVPPVSSSCQAYKESKMGAVRNVYNDANIRLQGFLLSKGASIPALAAGAAFGFWGDQTESARVWFNSTNNCEL